MAQISRRGFLQSTAIASAATTLAYHSSAQAVKASQDIRIAVIGLGIRGSGAHLESFGRSVVAVCDCDESRVAQYASKQKKIEGFSDYRKLLERDDIDAVSIATPNHTHAIIAIAAAQAGKDVYVEKPVAHNVWEGQQLVNAARKYNRIVQCGTQIRSSSSVRSAVQFVRDGKIGKIKYVVGTCHNRRESIGKLDQPLTIPRPIDYDLWCGPAAKVDLYRPKFHYDWHWDFNTGNGDMGNQGIHQMDIARWFLGETELSPLVVSAGGRFGYDDAANTPNTLITLHDYEQAPLIFETRGLTKDVGYRGSHVGVVIQCEHGHVLVPSYTSAIAYDSDGEKIDSWNGGGNHFDNFLEAVASRNPSDLNAEILEGHLSSALCHTGNVSYRLGQQASVGAIEKVVAAYPRLAESFQRMTAHLAANLVDVSSSELTLGPVLKMDPQAERFTSNEQANALLTREYREPFTVSEVLI
ncbi:MAG: Gfo/Idh/MocA family protein [Bythopirellula sp.]